MHGGGLLAGGLAYRLFLWLLPIGLVGAVLLGFWLDANDESVEGAAKEFGIGAAAVASAYDAVETSQSNRVLLLVTRSRSCSPGSRSGSCAPCSSPTRSPGACRGRVYASRLGRAHLQRPRHQRQLASAALAWLRAELGWFGILGVAADDRLPGGDRRRGHVASAPEGGALAGARPGRGAGRGRLSARERRGRLLLRPEDRTVLRALRDAGNGGRAAHLALRASRG